MDRRTFLAISAGMLSARGIGRAQEATLPEIWGPTVAPQPFDRSPFREIRIPAWLEESLGAGYTLSAMGSKDREAAAKAGVTISELGFVDPFYAYYDSALLTRRSPHRSLEMTDRDVAEYQRLGVRILGVYPPTLQAEVYELHPDWRRIPTDTQEIPSVDLAQHPYGGMLCLLGPYGDFFIEVLAEILTKFPAVDAFSFDGLHYAGACYCQHCRANFRADTGENLPPFDINQSAFRRYQHWADRRLEGLIVRMQTRLKAIKPDVALVTWTTNGGRFGHFLDVPRNMPARMNLLLDAPDMEFWLDETNRGASIVPAFGLATMWAYTNHRVAFAEPYLMSRGNPYGKDSFPAHEIERRMLLAVAQGCRPSLAVAQPPHLQAAAYHCLGEVKKRGSWIVHTRPEPWAAIVMSDNTRCFYARGDVEQRYLANVLGVFRAGLEAHLPVTIIADWNLAFDDLKKYRVLILANTASLDDRQTAAIREYVEAGGGLIVTLDTGLCDEFGDPRTNPALTEICGLTHLGPAVADAPPADLDVNFARTLTPEHWANRGGAWDLEAVPGTFLDALQPLIGTGRVTFKGPAARVQPEGANVIATLHPKPGSQGAATPAILTHAWGKGRVVTFAAGTDAANYLTPYPYYRLALATAIEHVAAAPPPVRVQAPMCVQMTVARQDRDGSRLVIHLNNDVNTTAFHASPANDVPLREEAIPIHDVRVELRGYDIRRVHLEPDGIKLAYSNDGTTTTVIVPRLDIHAMVVVELER